MSGATTGIRSPAPTFGTSPASGAHPPWMVAMLELLIDGRTVQLSRPDKVLFPATGFTKRDVVEYLLMIAPALLPHLARRAVTLARFPDGVDAPWWFQSNCPRGRPDWLPVVEVRGSRGQLLRYCRIEEPAALAWAANTGALEFHPFLSAAESVEAPLALVFDLDPSPPAGLGECCAVALRIRAILDELGLTAVAKTSGRSGVHMFVQLDGSQTFAHTKTLARAIALRLAKETPHAVSSTFARAARGGKVLVDWRQNAPGLQTVAPYSLRGTPIPRVSTPVTWDEIADAAARSAGLPLAFGPFDVLERVARHGDLFRGPVQRLPGDPAAMHA